VTAIRVFKYTPLPTCQLATADDWLDALIEAIGEEFDDYELQAFAKLPIAQDPIYALVRKHYPGAIELVDIARIYGLTRERIRQIEVEALAKVRGGMMEWRPE
jgi:hypothetical protein